MLDTKRLKATVKQEDNRLKLTIKFPIPCMREVGGFNYNQNVEYIEYSYYCISYMELDEILENFKRSINNKDYRYCKMDRTNYKQSKGVTK